MLQHFTSLRPNEIGKAPIGAGLYAWYGVINAGVADWALIPADGGDVGERNSRNLLKSHTSRYEGLELSVTAKGGLAAEWSGSLKDRTSSDLLSVLESREWEEGESGAAPKLQTSLRSPQMRESMFRVLQAATPILAAPLYIGVAKSLRQRLSQHTEQLSWLWGKVSKDRSFLERAEADDKIKNTFAYRAVTRGFSVDTVQVWALDISQVACEGLDDEELRTVAEASEWLLNRWHRPVLGRR